MASEPERGADRDRRRAAAVDGVDDLGVVDALEVDGGNAEVAVAELALDDDQRHAFARHLDAVGVAKLGGWGRGCGGGGGGRGAAAAAGRGGGGGGGAGPGACPPGGRPRVAPLMTQN